MALSTMTTHSPVVDKFTHGETEYLKNGFMQYVNSVYL